MDPSWQNSTQSFPLYRDMTFHSAPPMRKSFSHRSQQDQLRTSTRQRMFQDPFGSQQNALFNQGFNAEHMNSQQTQFDVNLDGYTINPDTPDLPDIAGIITPQDQLPWTPAPNVGPNAGSQLTRYPVRLNVERSDAMSDPLPQQELMERFSDDQATQARLSEAGDSGFQSQPYIHSRQAPLEYNHDTDELLKTWPLAQNALSQTNQQQRFEDALSVKTGPPCRTQRRSRSRSEAGYCPECHRKAKSPSDSKKHMLQHRKPFKCNMPNCKKSIDGFGTQNDLERHKKSVHQLNPVVGSKYGYVCSACNPPGKQQGAGEAGPKWWPRLDNFKAHIKRKHDDKDVRTIVEESKREHRPSDAQTVLTFHDSGIEPSQTGGADNHLDKRDNLLSPMAAHYLSREPSRQPQGDYLSQTGGAFGQPLPGFQHLPGLDLPSLPLPPVPNSIHVNPVLSVPTPATRGIIHKRRRISDEGQPLREFNTLDASSHWLGLSPKEQLDYFGIRIQSGKWQCRVCKKVKPRECDFKKHIKRHTKPYGCTFGGCLKRFGSRNDWKRHESTQHHLQDHWLCDCGSVTCQRVFHQEALFRTHLQEKGIGTNLMGQLDYHAIDQHVRNRHLGRNAHYNFYCGFCKKVVPQTGNVNHAWESRCDHIGNHFDKDGCTIHSWLCIIANEEKGKLEKDETERKKLPCTFPFPLPPGATIGNLSNCRVPVTDAEMGLDLASPFSRQSLSQTSYCSNALGEEDADGVVDEQMYDSQRLE